MKRALTKKKIILYVVLLGLTSCGKSYCDLINEVNTDIEIAVNKNYYKDLEEKYKKGYKKYEKKWKKPKFKPYMPAASYIAGKLLLLNQGGVKIEFVESLKNLIKKQLGLAIKNFGKYEQEQYCVISEGDLTRLSDTLFPLPIPIPLPVPTFIEPPYDSTNPVPPDINERAPNNFTRKSPPKTEHKGPDKVKEPFTLDHSSDKETRILISYGGKDSVATEILFETAKYQSDYSYEYLEFLKKRLQKYLEDNDSLNLEDSIRITIKGTTDAKGIKGVRYDGEFGDVIELDSFIVRANGIDEQKMYNFKLKIGEKFTSNHILALLRAYHAYNTLKAIPTFSNPGNTQFQIISDSLSEVGFEYRKIIIEINIKNAWKLRLGEFVSADSQWKAKVINPPVFFESQTDLSSPLSDSTKLKKVPKNIAIVIGIQNLFNDRSKHFNYAIEDAKGFVDLLKKKRKKDEIWEIFPLMGRSATKDRMLKTIQNLSTIANPDDKVFFFFSGPSNHGKDGKVYLLPFDADLDYPEEQGLNYIDLFDMILRPLPAKQVFFLVDGHPSSKTGDKGGDSLISIRHLKNGKHPYRGEIGFISANIRGSFSLEGSEKSKIHNGLFAYYIIKGLEGEADGYSKVNETKEKDGKVDLNELYNYTEENVRNMSLMLFGKSQVVYFNYFKN